MEHLKVRTKSPVIYNPESATSSVIILIFCQ